MHKEESKALSFYSVHTSIHTATSAFLSKAVGTHRTSKNLGEIGTNMLFCFSLAD